MDLKNILKVLDHIFESGASEKDQFVRKTYPLQPEIVNRFVHKALQLTGLPLDSFGCYKSSMGVYQVAGKMVELLKDHYAETVIALLTYSADDCVVMNNVALEALEVGFGGSSKLHLRELLWEVKSPLPIILAREALKDALKGIDLEDYSVENLRNTGVFNTLKLIEAANF